MQATSMNKEKVHAIWLAMWKMLDESVKEPASANPAQPLDSYRAELSGGKASETARNVRARPVRLSSLLAVWAGVLLFAGCTSATAATPNVTLTQNAASIGRYDIYELTMTNPAVYANPWEDVVISAALKAPSGKTYNVGGFSYDGANTWMLRFAPMETGNWTWTLSYTDGSGVFNASGGFACVASSNSGFLHIHPKNPTRFMTEGDGKAFYPLGFNSGLAGALKNGTTSVGAYTLANATDFLLTFKNAGNNMWRDNCQSATPIGWGGNFNINGTGKNVFDPVQCKLMDQEGAALHSVGWKFQLCFWTTPFLNNFDLSGAAGTATLHLHQFMINRYGAYADVWELMNEGFPTQTYMDTITTYVRANDPYAHPITLSYPATNQSDMDVTSPHLYISSSNASLDSYLNTINNNYTANKQPIIYGEAGEGAPSGSYDPDRYRTWIWTSFFIQTAPIFWLQENDRDFNTGTGIANQYIGWEERTASKIFTDYIAGFDPAALPLAATLNPAGQLRCYALASSADLGMYLVHSTNQDSVLSGATVTVNVPASMQGTWLDPLTGQVLQTVSVTSGQQTLSIPPFSKNIAIRLRPGGLQQPVLQFSSSSYSVNNDQTSVTLTVSRLGSGSGAVNVDYSTSDGMAKAGSAYTAISGTLSWAANDTSPRTITVPLIPQTTVTGDREFLVKLSNPTGGATLGSANTAQVTLLNTIYNGTCFTAPTYTVSKGAASVVVSVNRTGNGTGPFSTYCITINLTAVAGTDFVGIPANTVQLNWAAGDFSTKTFSVQLLNNTSTGNKIFGVQLPGGGDAKLGVRSRVVIVDNGTPSPGLIGFNGYNSTTGSGGGETACIYNVSGAAGTAQIHVSRTNGSKGVASISYQSDISGSAQAGTDYTAVSGTLSWADGDAADKIISVPILNNTTARGSPWFELELSNPVGAMLIFPQSAKVIIADPNPPPAIEIIAPTSGPSAGGTQTVVSGMNFATGASVSFGPNPATAVNVVSSSSILCTTPSGSGTVSVSVTNPDGQSATLAGAYTYVSSGAQAPTITTQPTNQTVTAGQTATFTITAAGTAPLTYQWKKNGSAISGATSASYTTPATTMADNGAVFAVVVSNSAGSVTSNNATLTVNAAPVPPSITTQPANQTVNAGQTATFAVTAAGTAPLTYQWKKNGSAISGATSASYTTPATTTADNGAVFVVGVSNSAGSVTSNNATLTVNAAPVPPSITTQPANQTVNAGQSATFTVTATGTAPLTYQWKKNGSAISGATSASYITPATTMADNGAVFAVVVSNSVGSATSNNATLTVNAAPVPPSITTQPANQTVTAGQTATFSIVASGTAPLTYQWQKNNINISGATNASYTTPATTATDNGSTFGCVVSNAAGSVTSNAATLTVNAANQPPVLTSAAVALPNPAVTGQTINFSASASDPDGDPLVYSWNFGDGSTGSGASATHVYLTAGSFTAAATVTDGHGGSVSSSVTVSITTLNTQAVRINSGGKTAGSFMADTAFAGGNTYSTTAPINVSAILNPAPQAVYQTERYGNFTYTVAGLTPNAAYLVRLHFAEIYWNSAGQRLFNVSINAQQVLSKLDIFAAAGGKFIAIVREFNVTANDRGQIAVVYSTLKDNAKSSGIEILASGSTTATASAPSAAAVSSDTGVAAIDLGTVKLNQPFKLKLEAPETGSLSKKLRWSMPDRNALPKGVKVSGGIIGGKAHALGTFSFKLQIASKGGGAINSYTLTVTP